MNIQQITYDTLAARLAKITAAESVTRHELGELSREVLAFVVATEDVRIINLLVGKGEDGKYTLTSQNRKAAGFFMREFVPFSDNGAKIDDGATLVFLKKKAKVWDKLAAKIDAFLAVEENNIWTWADAELSIEPKPKAFAGKITKLVEKSLKDEVEGISGADVINAVLAGGVTIDDLMSMVDALTQKAA